MREVGELYLEILLEREQEHCRHVVRRLRVELEESPAARTPDEFQSFEDFKGQFETGRELAEAYHRVRRAEGAAVDSEQTVVADGPANCMGNHSGAPAGPEGYGYSKVRHQESGESPAHSSAPAKMAVTIR